MLTTEDIQNIIKAEKEVFYSKTELDEKFQKLETSFASLQTSVDGLAVIFKQYHDEQKILVSKVNRMEEWIRKVSAKLGVEYNP